MSPMGFDPGKSDTVTQVAEVVMNILRFLLHYAGERSRYKHMKNIKLICDLSSISSIINLIGIYVGLSIELSIPSSIIKHSIKSFLNTNWMLLEEFSAGTITTWYEAW